MNIEHLRLAPIILLALTLGSTAHADEVIFDDLIVDGSVCVGVECMDMHLFDFDTIVLKSSDPQIKFQDTSSSAMFPTNDWAVGITDNGAGGLPTFSITDVDTGTAVLQLQAATDGGVAIGAGAEIEANAVSFGASGATRKIVNVAEGTDDTDAVNKEQFDTFAAQIDQTVADEKAELDTQITGLQAQLDGINAQVADILSRIDAL